MRYRVLRHPLDHWIDPEIAFAALFAGQDNAFWLDSGVNAATGFSYQGVGDRVVGDLDALARELSENTVQPDAAATPFALGFVGWLGYGLRAATMGEPELPPRYPDAALAFVDTALEFDHSAHSVSIITLRDEIDASWIETLAGATAPSPPRPPAPAEASWRYSDEEYLWMIEECQRAIREGDAYQLCLTTEVTVAARVDPFDTYRLLRASSPTHHGGFITIGGVSLLSASPERFLAISPGGVVESSPIKGTRRRGDTGETDDSLRAELESSDKERAENLMIVDLMRNDIGRISRVGSVTVPRLLEVESYAHVHQLVSTVRGELEGGIGVIDAVRACFPAGSMTGAPKLSATRILAALERRSRGIYAGAFGYFGLDGGVDLAMVIRSIVIDDSGATVGTGGGITALSVPTEELEETRVKAAALLAVLGAAR